MGTFGCFRYVVIKLKAKRTKNFIEMLGLNIIHAKVLHSIRICQQDYVKSFKKME